DLSHIQAHTGADAAASAQAINARAYATGNHVVFGQQTPDLHTAAHEAAHVVQQRAGVQLAGGVGHVGDKYEQQADAVADRVVAGESAEGLLDRFAAPPGGAGPAGKPVQRKWYLSISFKESERFKFWRQEGDEARTPAPTQWKNYPEGPDSDVPAMTIEQYGVSTKGGGTRESSDNYNPFGRFSRQAASSFLPSRDAFKPELLASVLRALAANDGFIAPENVTWSDRRSERGFPVSGTAMVKGQLTALHLVSETAYGAHYADQRPENARAQVKNLPGDPSALGLKPGPIEGALKQHSVNLTPEVLKSWKGEERSEQQVTVMGASAADAAANAGFDRDEGLGWQWLHLVAHSMGGIAVVGPQVPENLVAGTTEANTQMIIVEEYLKDLVEKTGLTARLHVAARMYDAVRHIGSQITYDFVLYHDEGTWLEVYHWTFDCLSRQNPVIAENRQVRYVGRAMFGISSEKKKGKQPKKGSKINWEFSLVTPKAQQTKATMQEQIIADWDRFKEEQGAFLEVLGQYGADTETPEQAWTILGFIHSQFGGAVAPFSAYLGGFVRFHPDAAQRLFPVLLKQFGQPDKVPHWVLQPFLQTLRFHGMGPEQMAEMLRTTVGPTEQAQIALRETTRSGNCLYEAVNIVLGNQLETVDALRELAGDYILEHPELAQLAGLDLNQVIATLTTPGAWAGDEGDLAPVVLASVVERQLKIVTDNQVYLIDPAGPVQGQPLTLYLHGDHYTVRPVNQEQVQAEQKAAKRIGL
ncbi:MAG TPA: DUF4157 domain-containing protein, partial [Symbiobacteriaceae bacterium]|nr:DUF4157 domain-containing protein [Symbiobacteriaceae bacterium]